MHLHIQPAVGMRRQAVESSQQGGRHIPPDQALPFLTAATLVFRGQDGNDGHPGLGPSRFTAESGG